MNDLRKSALWALISVPITIFGTSNSYAMAHGAILLIILLYPGLVAEHLVNGSRDPNSLLGVVGFSAQYVSYFLFIYLAFRFKRLLGSKST